MQKTIKMGIHTMGINCCHKFTLCCRDTSTSRNDNLQFTSCSNEKDIIGWQVSRYAWNFERCSADHFGKVNE